MDFVGSFKTDEIGTRFGFGTLFAAAVPFDVRTTHTHMLCTLVSSLQCRLP